MREVLRKREKALVLDENITVCFVELYQKTQDWVVYKE